MSSAARKLEEWHGDSHRRAPPQLSTELEQILSTATVASAPAFLQRELLQLERQIAALRAEQQRLLHGAHHGSEPPPTSLVRPRAEVPTLRPSAGGAQTVLPSPSAQHPREAITRDAMPKPTLSPPTCRPSAALTDGRYSVVPIGEQVSIWRR